MVCYKSNVIVFFFVVSRLSLSTDKYFVSEHDGAVEVCAVLVPPIDAPLDVFMNLSDIGSARRGIF